MELMKRSEIRLFDFTRNKNALHIRHVCITAKCIDCDGADARFLEIIVVIDLHYQNYIFRKRE